MDEFMILLEKSNELANKIIDTYKVKPGFKIEEIFETIGIKLIAVKDLPKNEFFGYQTINNEWVLFYDHLEDEKNRRWSLAYALGNLILASGSAYLDYDTSDMISFDYQDKTLYKGNFLKFAQFGYPYYKLQRLTYDMCNNFRYQLLTPEYQFCDKIEYYQTYKSEGKNLDFDAIIDNVSHEFIVPETDVIRRCKQLKLIK